ncbi:DMT family transporter [Roseomonas eburnea]|uniref:DMT family transporter n=1 Tax=Neoroseomonas eburnea TaxID=1346889 RepID=A0A9X9XC36_9PROT|nr:DMT family transporter [Neoroseomonas eburnea]MBR0681272.1 DMT family transporter [Neoroseomonas eburnea]
MHDALRMLPPLFLLGTLWGVTPVFVKHLGGLGWPPLMIAVFGATGSSAILLGLCRLRGIAIPVDARHLRYYAVSGLFGMALANLVGFTSLQHVPAGFFAMLVPLSPMLTVLGAALIGAERATPRRVLGTVLGLAGVLLAMSPGAALPDRSVLSWATIAALTPVCYAASNLFAARLAPQGTPPLALATGTLAIGAVQVAVFAMLFGQFRLPPLEGVPVSALQIIVMASAFLLWFRSIVTYGGVVTSQTGYIITLTGMAWGWLLFGERPGPLTVPAAMLVFAGLALVTLPGRSVTRSGA